MRQRLAVGGRGGERQICRQAGRGAVVKVRWAVGGSGGQPQADCDASMGAARMLVVFENH